MNKFEYLTKNINKLSMIPLVGKGKVAAVNGWQKFSDEISTFTVEQLSANNYGIVTGPASKLLVLDIDDLSVFESFLRRNNYNLPDTFTVKTGKGYHKYFKYPNDGNTYGTKPFGTFGFDIRGKGGYVVGPFGEHEETGNQYKIIGDSEIAEAPAWLLSFSLKVTGNSKPDLNKRIKNKSIVETIVRGVEKGERSEAIYGVLLSLIANGFNDDQIYYVFNRFPIGNKYLEKPENLRDSWLRTQIEKAREVTNDLGGRATTSNPAKNDSTEFNDVPDIKLIDGDELLEKKCKVEWLVKDKIEKGGHLLLTAKSGQGKSMLVLNMALTLAAGLQDEFLGEVTKPYKVVMIQSENSEAFMQRRLNDIINLNPNFSAGKKNIKFAYFDDRHDSPKVKLSSPNLKEIIRKIYEQGQPDVIILDPYKSYAGTRENDNDENREVLDNFFYLLGEYGTTAIIVHHEGKSSEYTGTSRSRGASTITDVMSNHWTIYREKDKSQLFKYNIIIECVKARNHEGFDDITLGIVGGVYFTATDTPYDPVKLTHILQEESGQINTQAEFIDSIKNLLGVSTGKARLLIENAISKKLIITEKYGNNKIRYRLPAYDKAA